MARHLTFTDDEIVGRARAVFLERGYAARTKEIAAAVGLTWGAIALRFGAKRELFRRAMLDPDPGSGAADCTGGVADLRALLEQVRAELCQQWPRRLHYRLATQGDLTDEGWRRLAERLGSTLQAHAACGAVRADISGPELAQLVLDLLVGDVARRYLRREAASHHDPRLIERVLRLVEAREPAGVA